MQPLLQFSLHKMVASGEIRNKITDVVDYFLRSGYNTGMEDADYVKTI